MPFTKLNFRAGINKEETDYSQEGGWVDGNFIRFRKGRVEKIGGWEKRSTNSILGSARALHGWIALGGEKYLGVGTTLKYYIEEAGTYNDVTPLRLTTSAGDVTFSGVANTLNGAITDTATELTLTSSSGFPSSGVIQIDSETIRYEAVDGNNLTQLTRGIESTTAASHSDSANVLCATLTVSDTSHGAVVDDFVTFSGSASLGGNITATVLNQEYQVEKVINANSYTVHAKNTSGTTVFANSSDSGNGGSSVVGRYQVNVGLEFFVSSTGWGANGWNEGSWGSAATLSATNQLRIWTHDNYGEDLIINPRGGGIFRWVENDGVSTRAVNLATTSGANKVPTKGLQVITSETDRHLIVLGADPLSSGSRTGTVDPMLVAFSDQENPLEFEPKNTNTAGSLRLSSGSSIIGGLKSRQEILIWTDTSLYSMNFIGPPLTFAINLINEGAGLIAPKAAVNAPNGVFFMSKNAFYFYNGSVQKLSCSVQDYVFSDLDVDQAFKCFAALNEEFSEVWFFYPSIEDGTREISRYVIYNYEEGSWSIGLLERHAWLESGVFDKPLASADVSSNEFVFEHEKGFNNDDSAMDNVFVESADIDIGDGDNFVFLRKVLPDILFVNETGTSQDPAVNLVVKRRDFNNQTLSTDSTSQIKGSTTFSSLRTRARQFVLRFESDDDNNETDRKNYKWRLGDTRVDIVPSGRK